MLRELEDVYTRENSLLSSGFPTVNFYILISYPKPLEGREGTARMLEVGSVPNSVTVAAAFSISDNTSQSL
jgi:hypothetical protein